MVTRYEKTVRSFMGVLCLAASMDWLKPRWHLTQRFTLAHVAFPMEEL